MSSDHWTVGFTGSQGGMTGDQAATLARTLDAYGPEAELHHGDCVGADAEAHVIALRLGVAVVIHPPENESRRAFCEHAVVIRGPLPYMQRNAAIVEAADVLLAAPSSHASRPAAQRSGTWATVRRARAQRVPVVMIWPDGTVTVDDPHRKEHA